MIKIQHKMELKVVLKQSMLLVRLEKDGEKERRTKFQFRYFLTNLKGLLLKPRCRCYKTWLFLLIKSKTYNVGCVSLLSHLFGWVYRAPTDTIRLARTILPKSTKIHRNFKGNPVLCKLETIVIKILTTFS